tara:strand:- start:96 stop:545 length:450 start_codon:yes stop_codon:yes gene_type:complete
MKTKLRSLLFLTILSVTIGNAQNETTDGNNFQFGQPEHFLDGYSMNFQYQDGTAVHIEFYNGKAKYEWVSGPGKGKGNHDIPYRSRKIGNGLYLMNWHETDIKDYLTLVFDFEKMLVHNSVIIGYENRPERTLKTVFKSGIIDHLKQAE